MKKDVLISIKGIQSADGESDAVELTTRGSFYRKKDDYYICYDESLLTGMDGMKTVLKVEGSHKVTMTRSGSSRQQLIIEKGARHQCRYDVGFDFLTIGVSCDSITSKLTDSGGELNFKYSLDINTALSSENEVFINIEECKN